MNRIVVVMNDLQKARDELRRAESQVYTAKKHATDALFTTFKEKWNYIIGTWYKISNLSKEREISADEITYRKYTEIKRDNIFFIEMPYINVKITKGWRNGALSCTMGTLQVKEKDADTYTVIDSKDTSITDEALEADIREALLATKAIPVEHIGEFLYFSDYYTSFIKLNDFCVDNKRSSISMEEARNLGIDKDIPRMVMERVMEPVKNSHDIEIDADGAELYAVNIGAFIDRWYLFAGLGSKKKVIT